MPIVDLTGGFLSAYNLNLVYMILRREMVELLDKKET